MAQHKSSTNHCTPSATLSLIEGYKRFRQIYFEKQNIFNKLVEKGQSPKTLFIACCDSRVDPAIITDCNPGELFVIRNIANLVPKFNQDPRHISTSAAIEYAVIYLNVSDIVIMGHSHCGGIRACLEEISTENHTKNSAIPAWVDLIQPAKKALLENNSSGTTDEKAALLEKASLIQSLQNLNTFPWIKERVNKEQLQLHAWYFQLETGAIESYQIEIDRFIPLA